MGASMWTHGWCEPNPCPLEGLRALSSLCVCLLALHRLQIVTHALQLMLGSLKQLGACVVGTELITQDGESLNP